ncbi:MAG: serine hydrolase, partial [Firmicutes bacterium]|nr:serine hydrolase [Bacillota bacterium]
MQHTITELETALQKRIKEMKLPGVSVCIRGPEGVIYEKGFGKRSIEQDLDVTPETVFGIASMSKSFTALSCCILAAEGKMSLEDPITKYFPTLHLKGVPDELVTIRQIGLHRAGIPPMEPLEWSIAMNTPGRKSKAEEQLRKESPNQMDTIEQIVDYIAEGRYRTLGEPGEYMSYSNEGYAILSYVVDQAAGMPLEQFLMERIFKPLGMTRTILDQDCSELKAMVGDGNVTRLFETDDDGKLVEDDSWSVLPPFRGCACIKSTAPDMARYYQMLSNRGVFEGKRIVPEEAIDLMFGPEYPLRRKPFNVMGLKKRSIAGKMVCDHGGGLHGVSTHGGLVEGGYGIAVLSNKSEEDAELVQWICYNFVLGLPLEQELYWYQPCGRKFSAPEMIIGDYVGHEGLVAHALVYPKDGKLWVRAYDEERVLEYCEGTVFAAV